MNRLRITFWVVLLGVSILVSGPTRAQDLAATRPGAAGLAANTQMPNSSTAPATPAPQGALSPSSLTPSPQMSNSDEVCLFLKEAVAQAFGRLPSSRQVANDPEHDSYHWVIMLQVAEPLTQGDERNFDRKNGLSLFLESLAREREARGAISDTISIIPYHFNILAHDSAFKQPLAKYLNRLGDLTKQIPGEAQNDRYPDGVVYRDGHSWRMAMTQMIAELKARNMDKNCVVIVLDWNDAEAVPQKHADGSIRPASRQFLVSRSSNKGEWDKFTAAMKGIGFRGNSLAYKKIGRYGYHREYYMEVFTPPDLQPLPTPSPVLEDVSATAMPVQTTVPPTPIAQGEEDAHNHDGNSVLWWAILPGVLVLAVSYFLINKPVGVQVDGIPYKLQALSTKTLNICGPECEEEGHQLRKDRAPNAPPYVLTVLRLTPSRKIHLLNKECKVVALEGCDELSGEMGVEMTDTTCKIKLCDSSNPSVALAHLTVEETSR